jgi:hypothetical protein
MICSYPTMPGLAFKLQPLSATETREQVRRTFRLSHGFVANRRGQPWPYAPTLYCKGELMSELVLQGWKIGFAKVSLTKLLRDEFGYSLSEAKAITDAILENKEIRLPCHGQQSEDVVAKLREIGVNVSVEVSGDKGPGV